MKSGVLWVATLLGAGISLVELQAQAPGSRRYLDPLDIPCAGRIVLRNDSTRDEMAGVKTSRENRAVLVRGRRAAQSYSATTLFLGDSAETVSVRWRGQEISRRVPSVSCFAVPRTPPNGYPHDQGPLVSNLARATKPGDPVPGLLLLVFRATATHEQRAEVITSIRAQVVGGAPEPAPGRWWLLVEDDSLGSRVREMYSVLKRFPVVHRVSHERLLPGAAPVDSGRSQPSLIR